MITLLFTLASAVETGAPLPADRVLQVLPKAPITTQLTVAAEKLGTWSVELAGVEVDGPLVAKLAAPPEGEPLTRWIREQTGRAVDVEDLVYFLDDVLRAEDRRGEHFVVHSGRARNAGILLHPDDVFPGKKPRVYPVKSTLAVDPPQDQEAVLDTPAPDHSPPGPEWTARYRNPDDRPAMLEAIDAERPGTDFRKRLESLMTQLEAGGAEVYLASTTRSRERGYLMWGAFVLSKTTSEADVAKKVAMLDDRNRAWKLGVPITWAHPDGWEATREGARRMAESYDVVYATENGAKSSNHYGAVAADIVALALPRRLTLTAPDGTTCSFDLSGTEESRDLSLTPRLIDWIEEHWGLSKLRSDYPHWTDVR